MRIVIATDAWHPQVNGVVRSLESTAEAARALGARVEFLTPAGFYSVPMPTYPEIRLSLATGSMVWKQIARFDIEHVHIATEGPLGLAVRHACLGQKRVFTTSYHTRFPEYVSARTPIPESWTYALLRWFHNAGSGIMVSTQSIADELSRRGFQRLMHWSRGVDHDRFHPRTVDEIAPLIKDMPRPIFLYAGRVAVEKNIEAFLNLDLPGTKLVVGDGPSRKKLEQDFPNATFVGMKSGDELATYFAAADVFVFPSRTDTFGIVLLEALACGTPVAAYPVPGPLDVIGQSGAGVLDENLRDACLAALSIPRAIARSHALTYTWENAARQFMDNIETARSLGITRK